jgi:chromosome segregation ATPase
VEAAVQPSENQMHAEIEALRSRFPRTQELYREVCTVLFFRYGITPTANKLYQLVRKGSMSAPTEALNEFWKTLRERSRVTVDHADLPEELRVAAGEMVAALWKSAQLKSHEAVAVLRAEAAEIAERAKADVALAQAAHAEAERNLERVRASLGESENLVTQLRQELAAAAATKAGLEERLEEMRNQLVNMQTRMDQANAEHNAERERLAERTQLAEERFSDMERRALLEIDRERTAASKLQKTLEAERAAHATVTDRLRADHNQAQATNAQLREQVGALQNAVETLNTLRNREGAELQTLRTQLEGAIRQGSADSARVDQLREELERTRTEASRHKKSNAQSGTRRKRKEGSSA